MKKLMIFIGVIALLLASFLFIPKTTTNYDMTIYLPDSSGTKQGLEIIKEEFEQESTIQILVMDVTPTNLLSLMEIWKKKYLLNNQKDSFWGMTKTLYANSKMLYMG